MTIMIFYLSEPLTLSTTIIFASVVRAAFSARLAEASSVSSRLVQCTLTPVVFPIALYRLPSLNCTNVDRHAKLPWKKGDESLMRSLR